MSTNYHVNGTAAREKTPLTAHELVKLQIENENFQLTDDDLRNINTTTQFSLADRRSSEESAESLDYLRPHNPQETLRD